MEEMRIRQEARDLAQVVGIRLAENPDELRFFRVDDGAVEQTEGDDEKCRQRQGFRAEPDADRAEETEEIEGVAAHRVGAFAHERIVLVAGDVLRAPEPPDDGDAHQRTADEEQHARDFRCDKIELLAGEHDEQNEQQPKEL